MTLRRRHTGLVSDTVMSADFDQDGRTEPRQWSWVHRALWSCAPKLGQEKASSSRSSVNNSSSSRINRSSTRRACCLELRIPDTILFERGEPCKWLGSSSEGIVVRKPFPAFDGGDGGGSGMKNGLGTGRVNASESISTMRSSSISSLTDMRRRPDLVTRITRADSSKASGDNMDEFQVLQRLDAVRSACAAFSRVDDRFTSNSGSPVCVAWYNDGTKELLSEESLSRLGGYYNWRASVTGLQAYVHPARNATGTYSRRDFDQCRSQQRRRNRTFNGSRRVASEDGHGSDTVGGNVALGYCEGDSTSANLIQLGEAPVSEYNNRSALDKAAADVAFIIDMIYAWPHTIWPSSSTDTSQSRTKGVRDGHTTLASTIRVSSDQVQRSDFAREKGRAEPPRRPKSRVRVTRLEAQFIVDDMGQVWFSHATRTLVQPIARPPQVEVDEEEEALNRKLQREEASLAASVAVREIRALVVMARRRGLNAEDIFEHFDLERKGYVDTIAMRKGMDTLGVIVSDEAAAIVVETVVAYAGGKGEGVKKTCSQTRTGVGPTVRKLLRNRAAYTCKESDVGTHAEFSVEGNDVERENIPSRNRFTAADLWTFSHTPEDVLATEGSTSHGGAEVDANKCAAHWVTSAVMSSEQPYTDDVLRNRSPGTKRRKTRKDTEVTRQHEDIDEGLLRSVQQHSQTISPALNKAGDGERTTSWSTCQPTASAASSSSLAFLSSCTAERRLGSRETDPERPHHALTVHSGVGSSTRRRQQDQENVVDAGGITLEHSRRISERRIEGKRVGLRGRSVLDKPLELASFPCADPVTESICGGKDRVFHVER